ncbi:MAG: alkaline phosphatase [Candidatus Coatesbacteria bacterium]
MNSPDRILAAFLIFSVCSGPVSSVTFAAAAAKSVIILVGDGMGVEQIRAASLALRGADGRTAMQGLPAAGRAATHSADEGVTDPAAAATALATGRKTNNGVLSISAGGTPLKTILEACRDAGKVTGLVSDSRITGETTAGFAVHSENAGADYELAGMMVAAKVNLLLGGGKSHFLAPKSEAWVGVNVLDAKGKKILTITDTVNWSEYRTLTHSFLAPAGAKKASVWVWRQSGPLGLYLDDVRLEPQDDKGNVTGPGRLIDPGFEGGGLEGWSDWGHSHAVPDGGSTVLKVTGQGGGEKTVDITAGTNWSVAYRVRLDDPKAPGAAASPWDRAAAQGYARIATLSELAGARGGNILGLFGDGDLGESEGDPTLAGLTGGALGVLGGAPGGFLLVVDGSRIDRACRAKDEKSMLRQVQAFDAAVADAVEFAKRKGDVLVVVTSGYETGGVKASGTDAGSLRVTFGGGDATAARVPVFAFGPGSEGFTGEMDNTEIGRKIAAALDLRL